MTCDVCRMVENLYGSTESVAPWLCECPVSLASELPGNVMIQLQMGWNGFGDYCDNGCCDYTDKHVRHTCKRKKSP